MKVSATVIQLACTASHTEKGSLLMKIGESNKDAICVGLLMTHPVEHSEGPIARAIEQQTAKLPSDAFLWAAGASIATSLILKLLDRHHEALFVGQWAPTILILGLYNKLVKQHGSDQFDT